MLNAFRAGLQKGAGGRAGGLSGGMSGGRAGGRAVGRSVGRSGCWAVGRTDGRAGGRSGGQPPDADTHGLQGTATSQARAGQVHEARFKVCIPSSPFMSSLLRASGHIRIDQDASDGQRQHLGDSQGAGAAQVIRKPIAHNTLIWHEDSNHCSSSLQQICRNVPVLLRFSLATCCHLHTSSFSLTVSAWRVQEERWNMTAARATDHDRNPNIVATTSLTPIGSIDQRLEMHP